MKVVFFGTPNFVLPIPQALLDTPNIELAAVVTRDDKPVGRKQTLTPSPVKLWAQEHGVPVITPSKLDGNFLNLLISQYPNIQIGILAAYGRLIPQEVINLFPKGMIVLHPSLLPKYRGPSPVQAAIAADETETGLSIIKMDAEMDHGPIIAQFKNEIKPEDTPQDLYDRLFKKAAEILVELLPNYSEGKTELLEQDHSQATYTHIIKKEHGFIPFEYLEAAMEGKTLNEDWPIPFIEDFSTQTSPTAICNFIRSLSPWPGAYTNVKINPPAGGQISKRLKILKSHLVPTINNQQLAISNLILDSVQLEGKNPVSWEQFKEAYLG